ELFENFWNTRNSATRKIVEREALSTRKQRARRSQLESKAKGLAFFLEHWGAPNSTDAEPINLPGASNAQSSAQKDFTSFKTEELEEIARLARRIVRRLARSPSRRWKPVRHGPRLNLRRSFRKAMRTGGELVELAFKRRKQKKTR